jgi:hypothetical protein
MRSGKKAQAESRSRTVDREARTTPTRTTPQVSAVLDPSAHESSIMTWDNMPTPSSRPTPRALRSSPLPARQADGRDSPRPNWRFSLRLDRNPGFRGLHESKSSSVTEELRSLHLTFTLHAPSPQWLFNTTTLGAIVTYSPNPYLNMPITPGRPRMFGSTVARVIWTIVPVISLSLLSAVPFVVAAVKGVVKPWLAITYVVGEILIIGVAMALDPDPNSGNPLTGFALMILIITSATHTALLDSEKVRIGK